MFWREMSSIQVVFGPIKTRLGSLTSRNCLIVSNVRALAAYNGTLLPISPYRLGFVVLKKKKRY